VNINQAAFELIMDGFETCEDLWLPHRFKLHQQYNFKATILGPCYSKDDDRIVEGIVINTWNNEHAGVALHPFAELRDRKEFLYGCPEFPDNVFAFISDGLCRWMSWWDVLEEEQRRVALEEEDA